MVCVQALRTLARCYLAMEDHARVFAKANEALSLAENIGDRQAVSESRLILQKHTSAMATRKKCAAQLESLTGETTESNTDLSFAGESHRLFGMLAMDQSDFSSAAQHFGKQRLNL